jgi:FAE1/Type III polyketide synthase-like protein
VLNFAEVIAGMTRPVNKSMKTGRAESELALFVSIQKLLDKTGINPKDVCLLLQQLFTDNKNHQSWNIWHVSE